MFYISKELKIALKMFNLSIPFIENDLKRNFRSLIKAEHPDKNYGDKKAEEKAEEVSKKILETYKLLKKHISTKINSDISPTLLKEWEEEEKDITNIYDPCPRCKGTKYEQKIISVRVNCPNCKGTGIVKLKCKYCDDGIYTSRKGFKIPCKSCHGSGIWKEVPCKQCNPASFGRMSYFRCFMNSFGIGYEYEDKSVSKICSNCYGRGKIKLNLFNPVIKKGSILV